MSLAAVGVAAGAISVNKHWTTDTLNSLERETNGRAPQILPRTNRQAGHRIIPQGRSSGKSMTEP